MKGGEWGGRREREGRGRLSGSVIWVRGSTRKRVRGRRGKNGRKAKSGGGLRRERNGVEKRGGGKGKRRE